MSASHPIPTVPEEARPYQGQRAGLVTRVAANTIDFLVLLIILAALYAAWSALSFLWHGDTFRFPTPSLAVAYLVGMGVLAVYFTAAWCTTGRSYGDHLLGLRVVSYSGGPMRAAGAFVRAVFCVLVPIGLFWCLVSRTNRSVQDLVVRTSVIYDWDVRPRGV